MANASDREARIGRARAWGGHLASDFDAHDVDSTMDTMVDDPYLLRVPVLTGGTGRAPAGRWVR